MRKVKLLLLLICFGASIALHAGETGNLVGKVKNEQGEPLQGAIVLVYLGDDLQGNGMTSEKGAYQIVGLYPGKYVVKFKRMGYQETVYEDIEIQLDVTRTLNVKLGVHAIKTGPIVVTGQKVKRLNATAGTSKRQNTSRDLEEKNIESINDLIAQSPGTVTVGGVSHARGGRANETTIMIDGMQVSDPVDGGAALSVDMDAVHTTSQMFSFPAEYGNSQSSVMNIITKSGTEEYEGTIKYSTDHFLVDGYNYDRVAFTLGGPILPFNDVLAKKFTFFINAALARSDGRDGQWRENNPYEDYTFGGRHLLANEIYNVDNRPYEDRDSFLGIDIDERNYNSYNYNSKFKYAFTPSQKMTIAVRGENSKNYPYNQSMKYALENFAVTENSLMQVVGNYDYTFSGNILKVKASYYKKNTKESPRQLSEGDFWKLDYANYNPILEYYGVYSIDRDSDGVLDSLGYLKANQWKWNEKADDVDKAIQGYSPPGSYFASVKDNTTENIQFRSDFQYNPLDLGHQIKTGLEIQRHFIERDDANNLTYYDEGKVNNNAYIAFDKLDLNPTGTIAIDDNLDWEYYPENDICDSVLVMHGDNGDDTRIYYYKPEFYRYMIMRSAGQREGYKASPWQAAYYIQDQFTFEGMKVNAGLRFDWWYLHDSYEIQEIDGGFRKMEFDGDTSQLLISPRFGILYPISERDNVSFLYNYQNQLPNMKHIFTTKDPAVDDVGNDPIGNSELEPQITVTYEVGYQHQFADDFKDYDISIQAYYKNIYNYVSTKFDTLDTDTDIKYFQYVSEDYGSSRGLEIELNKINGENHVSMGLSYSLSWSKGNNDSATPEITRTSLREFRLPWDIRHSAKFRMNYIIAKDDEIYIPGTDFNVPFGWKGGFNTGFNYTFSSGRPYTPVNEDDRALEKYSKEQDYVDEASLFFRKNIEFKEKQQFAVTFTINNLFDKRNVVNVYSKTGDPYEDGADLSTGVSDFVSEDMKYVHYLSSANPNNRTDGRTFRLELSYKF